MLSSGANINIWDYMLSSGMQCYHLELMLSSGMITHPFFICPENFTHSQSCWYFRPCFVNYCPYNLISLSTSPPPPSLLPVWISVLYTRKLCVRWGGGYGVLCLRQINTCRKFPLQVNFLDDILHCLLDKGRWKRSTIYVVVSPVLGTGIVLLPIRIHFRFQILYMKTKTR